MVPQPVPQAVPQPVPNAVLQPVPAAVPQPVPSAVPRLIRRLKNGRSQALDDDNGVNKLAETGETVNLAKNVFLPFFCEVLFEKGSAGEVHGLPGTNVKKLGLGSAETWHGGPTLRGSGCEVVNIKENLEQQRARCGDTPFLSISVMH